MARPRRQDARIEHVHFRLTTAEYAAMHAKAVEAGFQQVAAFCRAAALATTPYEDRPYPNGPTYTDRARCQELKQWGVSLSQLTRHITLHPHHPLPPDLAPLLATLRAVLARDLDYGA